MNQRVSRLSIDFTFTVNEEQRMLSLRQVFAGVSVSNDAQIYTRRSRSTLSTLQYESELKTRREETYIISSRGGTNTTITNLSERLIKAERTVDGFCGCKHFIMLVGNSSASSNRLNNNKKLHYIMNE